MSPVEGRLAKIETTLGHLNETWKAHTEQDKEHYAEISGKVEQLLLEQARTEGERRVTKRLAGYVSLAVSTVIGLIIAFINHYTK